MVGPEELLTAMEEEGVEAAVVLGFPWRRETPLAAAQRSDPRGPAPLAPKVLRLLRRASGPCPGASGRSNAAWPPGPGASGNWPCIWRIGPRTQTDVLAPVAELCQHYQVPLMLHTNDRAEVGATYPGQAPFPLAAAYQVIKAFPETTWILAHWGGGLPFYGLLKKEAPETFKNVYFDTAASPYIYRPVIYRVVADMVGPEKVIFGSDYPLLPPSRYVKEMGEANLPEDWQELILGKNLARLMGV